MIYRQAFGIPCETYYDWKEKFDSGYYEIAVFPPEKEAAQVCQRKSAPAFSAAVCTRL